MPHMAKEKRGIKRSEWGKRKRTRSCGRVSEDE
jgi:hypothetical protein